MDIWEHVVTTGDWGAEFRLTSTICEILRARNIFVGHSSITVNPQKSIRFPAQVEIEPYTSFAPQISSFSCMGSFSYSWSAFEPTMKVGRYCSIAPNLTPFLGRHPFEWAVMSVMGYGTFDHFLMRDAAHRDFNADNFVLAAHPDKFENLPVIENEVWIGTNVLLAPNITIGNGSIIGAGSVVTKDVAPYTIVAGNPAKVIRQRFDDGLVKQLLDSKWWEYDPRILKLCDYQNPEKFVNEFIEWRDKNDISPYKPEKITFRHILNDLMDRA